MASFQRTERAGAVPRSSLYLPAALLLIAIATALRILNFAGDRSLWLDESMIALNIIDLPFRTLASTLYFDQMAPVGWLLLQKLLFLAWGDFNYSLRIVSLVAGIAAIPVFFALARHNLGRIESLAALFLFGLSSAATQYSAMVKPYILDLLFSCALLLVGATVLKRGWTWPRLAMLWSLGLASILLSFGGCFVALSSGVVLFLKTGADRRWRWLLALGAAGLSWTGLFALTWLLSYHHDTTTIGNMSRFYWVDAFAPWPTTLAGIRWYFSTSLRLTAFLFGPAINALILLLVVAGAFGLRSRPWLLALLLGPAAVSLAAALAHAYPLHGRLQLFLLPPLCFLAARGIGALAAGLTGWAPRYRHAAAAVICLPLAFGIARATAHDAAKSPPWALEEVEPNLRILADERAAGDTVIVTLDGEKALLLYADKFRLEGLHYRRLAGRRDRPLCAYRNLRSLRGRVWFLTYHDAPVNRPAEKLLLRQLSERGRVLIAGNEPGSTLYRADLSRTLPDAPVSSDCYRRADFIDFRRAVAARRNLRPLSPEGGADRG